MLADNNQIDNRTTLRNQNRSAAFGRPAMKLLGGGGASTSLRSTKFDRAILRFFSELAQDYSMVFNIL